MTRGKRVSLTYIFIVVSIIGFMLVIFLLKPLSSEQYSRDTQILIYKVQKKLKSLGYDPGPIDGIWGNKTKAALKKFQKINNLNTTGKLDNKTKEILGLKNYSTRKSLDKKTTTKKMNNSKMITNYLLFSYLILFILLIFLIFLFKLYLNMKEGYKSEMIKKMESIILDELTNVLNNKLDKKFNDRFQIIVKPYVEKSIDKELPEFINKNIERKLDSSFKSILNMTLKEKMKSITITKKDIDNVIKNTILELVVEENRSYNLKRDNQFFTPMSTGGEASSSPLSPR